MTASAATSTYYSLQGIRCRGPLAMMPEHGWRKLGTVMLTRLLCPDEAQRVSRGPNSRLEINV
jgi:hypothetical protein